MILNDEIMALDDIKDDPWEGPKGPVWFVQGKFKGGGLFSIGSQSIENAHKKHADLKQLIGQPGEFEVEEKGRYRDSIKYKLIHWPGKPENPTGRSGFGGGGGGGGGGRAPYQPRYRDTPEGTRSEQDSIHRSVALTQAVIFCNSQHPGEPPHVIGVADAFYAWLSQGQPPLPSPAPAASSGPATQPQGQPHGTIGSYDPVKEQKDFFGASLTTGDRIKSKAVQKYLEEIDHAVKNRDSDRLTKLAQMIVQSLEKGSLTQSDIDQWIDPAISKARQAVQSSNELEAW